MADGRNAPGANKSGKGGLISRRSRRDEAGGDYSPHVAKAVEDYRSPKPGGGKHGQAREEAAGRARPTANGMSNIVKSQGFSRAPGRFAKPRRTDVKPCSPPRSGVDFSTGVAKAAGDYRSPKPGGRRRARRGMELQILSNQRGFRWRRGGLEGRGERPQSRAPPQAGVDVSPGRRQSGRGLPQSKTWRKEARPTRNGTSNIIKSRGFSAEAGRFGRSSPRFRRAASRGLHRSERVRGNL